MRPKGPGIEIDIPGKVGIAPADIVQHHGLTLGMSRRPVSRVVADTVELDEFASHAAPR